MTESSNEQIAFPEVQVPGSGEEPTADVLRSEIEAWIDSDAFTALASAEGARPDGNVAERLAYLDGFSACAWDFRAKAARLAEAGYIERNQVDPDEVSGDRERLTVAAASALGLATARPPRAASYDHVLILGGLVRATLWRSLYAGALLSSGKVSAREVTALTAFRDLVRNPSDLALDEASLLGVFGLPLTETEASVMEDCMAKAFALDQPLTTQDEGSTEGDHGRFRVATATAGAMKVSLVAAPNPKSGQRADTGQTMRYWAEEKARLKQGDTILFVTSSIYVPFQHVVAIQNLALPYGTRVETIGVDHSVVDSSPMPQTFRGVHYLQELRSTIRAFRQLLGVLDARSSP